MSETLNKMCFFSEQKYFFVHEWIRWYRSYQDFWHKHSNVVALKIVDRTAANMSEKVNTCSDTIWPCHFVPGRRHGGALLGLVPQTEICNTINQWNFCQFLMSSPPCTNVKPPPHKSKGPLLTTFWRRF